MDSVQSPRLGLIQKVVCVQDVARLVEEYASVLQVFLPFASPRAILQCEILDENLIRDTLVLGHHSVRFRCLHLRRFDVKNPEADQSRGLGYWKLPREGTPYPSQLSHFFLYQRLTMRNCVLLTFGFLRENGDHVQWTFRKITRPKKRKNKTAVGNGKIVQVDICYL